MKNYIYFFLFFCSISSYSQEIEYNSPGAGNPLLPGYFADPTIKKFGDTYYIYSTTDGVKLASGEPQVWLSKNLVNWYNYEMEIELPDGLTNCWAPDVLQGEDGKFYYFMGNCQFGCNIYGYVSDLPTGPWASISDGKPIIPVGAGKEHLPALDAQFFKDDDGSVYSFFGTWCTSFGGMGWGAFDEDKNFQMTKEGFIPIDQIPEAFEAAYMIKRDSIYFLMYSSGDCRLSSYAVQYAWSYEPEGPFKYGTNNPILSSSDDGTIDGPGHHSVLKEGKDYFIFYHRHDNPHSTGGEFRQVCVDKMSFVNDITIDKITPTHKGIEYTSSQISQPKNLAFNAEVTATSFYHLVAPANRYNTEGIDHAFLPEYAVDDNNGTIWKSGNNSLPQSLVIDLGKSVSLKRIFTQFEYPTYYYQYKIECSSDNITWNLFADRTSNRTSGSPMVDDNTMIGRYIKITITGTENAGMYAAIWNVKVYDQLFDIPSLKSETSTSMQGMKSKGELLVDLDFNKAKRGNVLNNLLNQGRLGGSFIPFGQPVIQKEGKGNVLFLDGNSYLELDRKAPESLSWNGAFTASVWVRNPEIGNGECLIVWNTRENMLQSSYAAVMYGSGHYGAVAHGDGAVDVPFLHIPEKAQWHHIAVSFDGMQEYVYVDGKLDRQIPISLFVENDRILIGASGEQTENFSGYLAGVQLYDKYFSQEGINTLLEKTKPSFIK